MPLDGMRELRLRLDGLRELRLSLDGLCELRFGLRRLRWLQLVRHMQHMWHERWLQQLRRWWIGLGWSGS